MYLTPMNCTLKILIFLIPFKKAMLKKKKGPTNIHSILSTTPDQDFLYIVVHSFQSFIHTYIGIQTESLIYIPMADM